MSSSLLNNTQEYIVSGWPPNDLGQQNFTDPPAPGRSQDPVLHTSPLNSHLSWTCWILCVFVWAAAPPQPAAVDTAPFTGTSRTRAAQRSAAQRRGCRMRAARGELNQPILRGESLLVLVSVGRITQVIETWRGFANWLGFFFFSFLFFVALISRVDTRWC